MKITMYELFGLIKEGKAPEKIKYVGTIYEYHESDNRYHKIISDFPDDDYDLSKRLGYMNFCYLGNEVEIIEEDKKIEKIPLPSFEQFKNMSAEEMFEKLGYIGYSEEHSAILYINITTDERIWFDSTDKTIEKFYQPSAFIIKSKDITLEELQAINKQVEELGWNK